MKIPTDSWSCLFSQNLEGGMVQVLEGGGFIGVEIL